ncbi:hypothetical protein MUK42_25625, partial [Musa troglodytarum]
RPLLDNKCIVFSTAEHGKKGCVVPRGGADGATEAGVALDVGNNTRKVKKHRSTPP